MEHQRIEKLLANGDKLVAEIGEDPNYNEIFIGVVDKNEYWQDLACISQDYVIDDGLEVTQIPNKFKILLWTDSQNDDYTRVFKVSRAKYEEE